MIKQNVQVTIKKEGEDAEKPEKPLMIKVEEPNTNNKEGQSTEKPVGENAQARPEESRKANRVFVKTALYVVAALAFALIGTIIF